MPSLATEQTLALAMARHPRLGLASPAAALDEDTTLMVLRAVEAERAVFFKGHADGNNDWRWQTYRSAVVPAGAYDHWPSHSYPGYFEEDDDDDDHNEDDEEHEDGDDEEDDEEDDEGSADHWSDGEGA